MANIIFVGRLEALHTAGDQVYAKPHFFCHTGALLRFPVRLLAELISCSKLFLWQMGLVIPPLFYLPYVNAYSLPLNQAIALILLFVTTSSMVRALGDWIADRYGGSAVNWSVFWVCIVCLFILSYPPTTKTIHGVEKDVNLVIEVNVWVFTFLILVIGIAQGFGRASVFKTIFQYYPENMGSVGARIIMLTLSDNDEDVISFISNGADGYLLKDMDP